MVVPKLSCHLHRWSRPTPGQDRFEVKYLRVKYLRDPHKPEAILLSLTPLVFERFLPSLTLWLSPNCLTTTKRLDLITGFGSNAAKKPQNDRLSKRPLRPTPKAAPPLVESALDKICYSVALLVEE